MKYFLLSAFSSSLLLLGIGLIYWQTGLTRLSTLQELLTWSYGAPVLAANTTNSTDKVYET